MMLDPGVVTGIFIAIQPFPQVTLMFSACDVAAVGIKQVHPLGSVVSRVLPREPSCQVER